MKEMYVHNWAMLFQYCHTFCESRRSLQSKRNIIENLNLFVKPLNLLSEMFCKFCNTLLNDKLSDLQKLPGFVRVVTFRF